MIRRLDLSRYTVLMLDMNNTFMFDEDRFSHTEDFHATYRSVGGGDLTSNQVKEIILACYHGMSRDYENEDKYDDFPSLRHGLRHYGGAVESELERLVEVFAIHEHGIVSPAHAEIIQNLAQSHQLRLLANIWSPKLLWLGSLRQAGVLQCFEKIFFSSDSRSIKPSLALFRHAMNGLNCPPEHILFIGDNLRCDILGAKQAGMDTLWLNDALCDHPAADYRLPSLLQLPLP